MGVPGILDIPFEKSRKLCSEDVTQGSWEAAQPLAPCFNGWECRAPSGRAASGTSSAPQALLTGSFIPLPVHALKCRVTKQGAEIQGWEGMGEACSFTGVEGTPHPSLVPRSTLKPDPLKHTGLSIPEFHYSSPKSRSHTGCALEGYSMTEAEPWVQPNKDPFIDNIVPHLKQVHRLGQPRFKH